MPFGYCYAPQGGTKMSAPLGNFYDAIISNLKQLVLLMFYGSVPAPIFQNTYTPADPPRRPASLLFAQGG